MRRLFVGALTIVSALALSGCSLVSTSSAPNLVNPNDVPLGLLDPTIPFTDFAQVHFVTRVVYMVDHAQQLIPVDRLMTSPPSLTEVLHYVALGPTLAEQANGVTTQVPASLVVNEATPVSGLVGVVHIDVSSAIKQLAPAARRMAVAQFLFSAAAIGASNGIELSVNQTPYPLLLATGQLVTIITPADLTYLLKP